MQVSSGWFFLKLVGSINRLPTTCQGNLLRRPQKIVCKRQSITVWILKIKSRMIINILLCFTSERHLSSPARPVFLTSHAPFLSCTVRVQADIILDGDFSKVASMLQAIFGNVNALFLCSFSSLLHAASS